MNNVTIFKNEIFGEIRGMLLNNKPYFVGRDIATILGYSNPAKSVSTHCKNGIKEVVNVTSQNGNAHNKARNTQTMTLIPEGDLYRLIIKSKLPKAQEFEEWVMDEVLPSIRKDGYYLTKNADVEKLEKELQIIKERNQLLSQENQALRFFDRQITGAWVKVNWDLDSLKIGDIDVPMDFVKAFISKYLNKHGQPKTDRESIQRVRFINCNLQLSMKCIKSILNSYSNFNIRNMEE